MATEKARNRVLPAKPLGRNQAIGLGALVTPWATATVMLALGKATFAEWTSFHLSYVWPGLVTVLGLGAGVAITRAIKGRDE